MQIVTLTTDWGFSDHYVGAVKGKLYSTIDDCNVVDITHQINKFDIMQGAFIVRNACLSFPKSTIHIIDVHCSENTQKQFQHVVIKYDDQYFICTDNGMPSLIFEGLEVQEIVGITNVFQESNYYTFSAFDLFCKVAALISYNSNIEEFGYKINSFVKRTPMNATIYNDMVLCTVFHIDSYGNLFLNITIDEFTKCIADKKFELKLEGFTINSISHAYDNVRENTPVLTVSSTNNLQLAINKGNASALLGLNEGSPIKIKISNQKSSPK